MLTGIKYKRKDSDFLFRNFIWEKEIAFVLSNSLPKRVECIEKATLDYDYENETFCMSFYSLGHKVEFIFRKNNDTIYDFIRLLELSTDTTEPLILDLYCIDYETNIYIEPLKKNFIRFCITDTKELNQQIKNGKIQRYSYRNS